MFKARIAWRGFAVAPCFLLLNNLISPAIAVFFSVMFLVRAAWPGMASAVAAWSPSETLQCTGLRLEELGLTVDKWRRKDGAVREKCGLREVHREVRILVRGDISDLSLFRTVTTQCWLLGKTGGENSVN